jgi:hypothetical protein
MKPSIQQIRLAAYFILHSQLTEHYFLGVLPSAGLRVKMDKLHLATFADVSYLYHTDTITTCIRTLKHPTKDIKFIGSYERDTGKSFNSNFILVNFVYTLVFAAL